MDSQRYVSIGDGNVYLVKNDPMDSFDVTIDALVKNDEIPNFNQVEKISEIKVSGYTSLDAKYKENDGLSDNEDDIYFVNKDKEEQPLDTNLVKTYLNNVNALNLGTYVTYNTTDEELAKYGIGTTEGLTSQELDAENHNSWILALHNENGILDWMISHQKNKEKC